MSASPEFWQIAERPGSTCPVLLLHGFLGDAAEWDQIVALFPELHALRLTLPGHGDVACPDGNVVDQLCDALASELAARSTIPCAILGYSLGGRIALQLALRYPELVSLLIVEAANPGIEDPVERQERERADDTMAARLEQDGLAEFLQAWYRQPLFASLALRRDQLVRRRARGNSRELAAALRAFSVGRQQSLWPRLQDLRCPSFWLAGALDPKYCRVMKRAAAHAPHGQYAIVPAAGHNVHLEQPRRYVQYLREILATTGHHERHSTTPTTRDHA